MSAGGSDYGGVVQGNLGQGFAQGAQQGIQNFEQRRQALERKAQQDLDNEFRKTTLDMQRGDYALKYLDGSIGELQKPSQMPDLEASTPEELEAWISQEQSKYAKLPALTESMNKAFGLSGIEIDAKDYIASRLGEDPLALSKRQIDKATAIRNFKQLQPKVEALKSVWADIGKEKGWDSPEAKKAFNAYNDAVNKPDPTLGVSYASQYEVAKGVKYVDPTADPAMFMQNARVSAVEGTIKDRFANLALTDPTAAAIITSPGFAALKPTDEFTLPDGRKTTLQQYVLNGTKSADVEKLVQSGTAEDLSKAMDLVYMMSEEQRSNLPDSVKAAWSTFTNYKNGTTPQDDSIYSRAVMVSKLPALDFKQKEANVALTTANTKNVLFDTVSKQSAVINNMARDAMNGVNVNTPANRALFDSLLPEGTSDADADKAWNDAMVAPYLQKQAERNVEFDQMKVTLANTKWAGLNDQAKAVTDGSLYLMSAAPDGSVDFTSDAYRQYVDKNGGVDNDTTRANFKVLFDTSSTFFDRKSDLDKANLKFAQAQADRERQAATFDLDTTDSRKSLIAAQAKSATSDANVAVATEQTRIDEIFDKAGITKNDLTYSTDTLSDRIKEARNQRRISGSEADRLEQSLPYIIKQLKQGVSLQAIQLEIAQRTKEYTIKDAIASAGIKENELKFDVATLQTRINKAFNEGKITYYEAEQLRQTLPYIVQRAKAGATIDTIQAEVATATKDAQISRTKAEARTAVQNAITAGVNARVATKTEGYQVETAATQLSIYKTQAAQQELELRISKSAEPGKLAANFQAAADVFGLDWLNSTEPERLFGKYMSPQALNSARAVAAAKIGAKQDAEQLSVLDQYLKNPRAWYKQTAKLTEVANRAGINPSDFIATMTNLAVENTSLSRWQIEDIKTGIWARQQNVDLGWAGQRLSESNRNDRNAQWRAEFAFGKQKWTTDQEWRSKEFNADQVQRDITNGIALAKLQQDDKALTIQQEASLMQFKGVVLPAMSQIATNARGNQEQYMAQANSLVANNQYLAQLANQIVFKNGGYTLPSAATPQQRQILTQYADLRLKAAAEQQVVARINKQLSTVVTSLGADSLTDVIGTASDPNIYTKQGNMVIPKGPSKQQVVNAVTSYRASTPEGRAVVNGIAQVLQGQGGGGAEIYQDGWCGRYVGTIMQANYNQIPGVQYKGNANDIFRSLKNAGFSVNGGAQLTSVSQLKDGMVLWQASPDYKVETINGKEVKTQIGHIAVYAGGKIWQNSYYKDNKVAGAVGWMEPEAFLKSFNTYGALIPGKYAKSGFQQPDVPVGKPTGSTGGGAKPAPAPAKPKPLPYSNSSGAFAFNYSSANIIKTGEKIATPNDRGGMQVNVNGQYYRVSSTTQIDIMNKVGAQAITYFNAGAKQRKTMTFDQLLKADPNKAVDAISDLLRAKGVKDFPQFAGDVPMYTRNWLRSIGKIK